jgi:hypothetical protein
MSVQIHDELADALVEVLEGVDVRGYKWSPGAIKPPCAVIEMPTLRRTEVDNAEDHVGADDWRFDFPVLFYVELGRDVIAAQVALMASAFGFVRAIDTLTPDAQGFVLNGLCTDAKVTPAEPFATPQGEEGSRTQIGYETHVSILTFQ